MNLKLSTTVMLVAGVILMYSAVKNKDPRDIVLTSLGQKARYGSVGGQGAAVGGAVAGGVQGLLDTGKQGFGPASTTPATHWPTV
jgi:hypothetical protein